MDRTAAPDGKVSLHIAAGKACAASWRATVQLGKGRYRFEATVTTRRVEPLNFGKNKGAGLRVIGTAPTPTFDLTGDHSGRKLEAGFTVEAEQEIELCCELRARRGDAWFDLDSLRLIQVQER